MIGNDLSSSNIARCRSKLGQTKFWAAAAYLVVMLLGVTLPFDPFLNRPPLIFPFCLLCAAVGLSAIYITTLSDDCGHPDDGGAS